MSFYNSTFNALDKAVSRGSQSVRDYFNNKNKKRKLGNWLCPQTKFIPVIKN